MKHSQTYAHIGTLDSLLHAAPKDTYTHTHQRALLHLHSTARQTALQTPDLLAADPSRPKQIVNALTVQGFTPVSYMQRQYTIIIKCCATANRGTGPSSRRQDSRLLTGNEIREHVWWHINIAKVGKLLQHIRARKPRRTALAAVLATGLAAVLTALLAASVASLVRHADTVARRLRCALNLRWSLHLAPTAPARTV